MKKFKKYQPLSADHSVDGVSNLALWVGCFLFMITINCNSCNKEFNVKNSRPDIKSCSFKCRKDFNSIEKKCPVCYNSFRVKKSHLEKRVCCSKECQKVNQKTKTNIFNNNWKGGIKNQKCNYCNIEFIPKNPYQKRKFCSHKCSIKHVTKHEGRKISDNQLDRSSKQNSNWKKEVLKRDKKCVRCGSFDKLSAHHIKPWAKNKDLRFDLNNGIILCFICHKFVHKTKDPNYIVLSV